MGKSIVAVYCGGRGSGKTLSMSVEGAIAMICGKKVWSNYPLSIGLRDSRGRVHEFRSKLIDMPDIIEIQKNNVIRHGLVLLDEWNLFCNARRSTALANIIFSGVVQLIRKRDLSFYITAQDFNTLDKNIRWQCDLTVQCYDLSFKYPNLKEGEVISQRITDWSGALTGRALSNQDNYLAVAKNTRTRLLHSKAFWGCYDTGFEYDVLDVMSTRYNLERRDKIISYLDDGGGFAFQLISEMKESFIKSNNLKISAEDMKTCLVGMGLAGDMNGELARLLRSAGFRRSHTKHGDFYTITKSEVKGNG